jgi:hypothetical protein
MTFNGRGGAVVLTAADVTAAGGALSASPALTGIPTAPTAATGVATQQLATTAFVAAAITALSIGVSSFNSRTGAVTLTTNDISAAGGAVLASPIFSGQPTAPTASPGTSTTQLATCAFVAAAIAAATGVSSFNGRGGAVTLTAADVTAAGGALLAGPAFTGVPTAPTAATTVSNTQLATTAFVKAAIAAGGLYLPLAGGTLTGDLTIAASSSGADSALIINAGTAGFSSIYFANHSGAFRWLVRGGDLASETGSNAGSDFRLVGEPDSGTNPLGEAIRVRRSDGLIAIGYRAGGTYFTSNAAIQAINSATVSMGMAVMNAPPNSWGMYFYNSSGAGIGGINLNESGVSYQTSSDARMKQDITAFTDGRDVIDALKVRRFRWRQTGKSDIGIVAQEAIAHYPDAVFSGEGQPGDSDFKPMGIDYSKYVPLLIEAVQDLNRQVGELERQIKRNGSRA